jgi:hypothetical protein
LPLASGSPSLGSKTYEHLDGWFSHRGLAPH